LTAVIATAGLSRSFGRLPAVSNVSLAVPQGSIYGLLGPNGAGKTTLLRLLLGLIRSDKGTVELFGEPLRPSPLLYQRIGAAIGDPAYYPRLSANDNLRVLAATRGIEASSREARVRSALAMVGLTGADGRDVNEFSSGMKRRLALAMSLLSDPELVVMDEPTSGLDPMGVVGVRSLVASLASEGKTVILSSHALSEVERLCDRVAIMTGGAIALEGEVSTLLARDGYFLIRTASEAALAHALQVLTGRGWQPYRTANAIRLPATERDAAEIAGLLSGAGVVAIEFSWHRATLEDLYASVVGGAQ
jgi:ABC-2 type transport system ATP-binding protein